MKDNIIDATIVIAFVASLTYLIIKIGLNMDKILLGIG